MAHCSIIFCGGNKHYVLGLDPLSKTGTGMKLSRGKHFQCTTCMDFTPSVEVISTGCCWSQDTGLDRCDPLMICILAEDRALQIWTFICSVTTSFL